MKEVIFKLPDNEFEVFKRRVMRAGEALAKDPRTEPYDYYDSITNILCDYGIEIKPCSS